METVQDYINYLINKPTSEYVAVPSYNYNNKYETFIQYYKNKGVSLEELFLQCIRKNNIIMFRKMLTDIRVNHSYQNNEAIILCILNNNYQMLSLLLQNPNVQPYDQNNLALRLAINKKDKPMLDLLLSYQSVLDHIYQDPDLLSYVWVYQNNGKVII